MKQSVEAIAANLRCHRESRGLSLDQLAELTGVSKSMLRQIETGKSSPTIATLWKVANGLKISFTSLLCKSEVEAEVKSFTGEQPLTAEGERYRLYPLVPFSPQQGFESYFLEMDTDTVFHGEEHEGNTYEYIFLLKGRMRVTVEEEVYEINAGEFLQFKADHPHKYESVGEETANAIMQISYLGV